MDNGESDHIYGENYNMCTKFVIVIWYLVVNELARPWWLNGMDHL